MDPSVEQQAVAAALYGDARSKELLLCLVCGDRARYLLLSLKLTVSLTLSLFSKLGGLHIQNT